MLASFLIELLAEAARQQSVQVELEARFRSLSRREHEVLELLVAGRNASDAAKSLYVSANTVRTHTRHIFGKLGVRSQVEAITLASRVGYTRLLRAGGDWSGASVADQSQPR